MILDVDLGNVEDPYDINKKILSLYGVIDTSLFTNVVTKAIIATKDGIKIIEK